MSDVTIDNISNLKEKHTFILVVKLFLVNEISYGVSSYRKDGRRAALIVAGSISLLHLPLPVGQLWGTSRELSLTTSALNYIGHVPTDLINC